MLFVFFHSGSGDISHTINFTDVYTHTFMLQSRLYISHTINLHWVFFYHSGSGDI